ncbi:jg6665 [Pararge aegeria aegeria]|uniref:Jg6665 protein n=1 Tax=Pararge aegeria aegeria TaxID=348720 RepID=A0A8S4SJV2_9NEOP|nr:jg6665 [Pararge aegeria aegeria]
MNTRTHKCYSLTGSHRASIGTRSNARGAVAHARAARWECVTSRVAVAPLWSGQTSQGQSPVRVHTTCMNEFTLARIINMRIERTYASSVLSGFMMP